MDIRFSPAQVNRAVKVVATQIATESRDPTWHSLTEEQLWAELVACILSSQVRHEACAAAHERLTELSLLRLDRNRKTKLFFQDMHEALARPFVGPDNSFNFVGRYRFPKSKSKQIAAAAQSIFQKGKGLSALLTCNPDPKSARRQLVLLCSGVGPKQASLFLRNIRFTDDLAILDTHVVRYMEWLGLVCSANGVPSSMRTYEQGEHRFQCHASECGFTAGTLDTAVWIVMRTISESSKCQS